MMLPGAEGASDDKRQRQMSFAPVGFTTAWHNSGEFLAQTWAAVARHPLLLLACSAVPAAERAYMLLQTNPIPR
jgi:uncharacterized membrane protein YraQ (UPF0718 family)